MPTVKERYNEKQALKGPVKQPRIAKTKKTQRAVKKQGWTFGLLRGQVWMSPDFDEPLTEEFMLGEE